MPLDIEGRERLVRMERPARYADVLHAHLPFAAFSGALLLFALLKPFLPDSLRACWFLRVTGYPCPFCGYSRTFAALAHGDWSGGFVNCPLAGGLFLIVLAIFLWNLAGLLFSVRLVRGRWLRLSSRAVRWGFGGAVVILIAANWMYRLGCGLK